MFGEKIEMRSRTIMIAALVVAGVFLGYVYVSASGKSTSTFVVRMDLEEGIVFDPGDSLGPEEREEIKAFAIEKVLEDEEIGTLLAGKEYSVEATIHSSNTIENVLQNSTIIWSDKRIGIVLEARPVVTVTITFLDGSGYNVRVEISDWSVGDLVYSEEVVPPALFREVVGGSLNRTRRPP
jgi:hypothetical protein